MTFEYTQMATCAVSPEQLDDLEFHLPCHSRHCDSSERIVDATSGDETLLALLASILGCGTADIPRQYIVFYVD